MPAIARMRIDIQAAQVPGGVLVVFTEESEGIKLVDPHTFTMVGDHFLMAASSVIQAQVQLRQQAMQQAIRPPGQRPS